MAAADRLLQAGDRKGSRLGHRLAACSPSRQRSVPLLPSPSLLGGSQLSLALIPTCAGGGVTADFLKVPIEISIQKGCFSCLPLILFFCMFECFQEELR